MKIVDRARTVLSSLSSNVGLTKEDKQAYYSKDDVVAQYDNWRFGSPGGRYVDKVELHSMLALLHDVDRAGKVLDMPCGTGRLSRALLDAGFCDVTGADYSPPMLEATRRAAPGVHTSREDAFATTFGDDTFDVICCLRFLFHTTETEKLFAEWARIAKPGCVVVFDTLRWTPRGLLPPVDKALGGALTTHSRDRIDALAQQHGFVVQGRTRALSLPSLAYRFLPSPVVSPLETVEQVMPQTLFTKSFYRLRRL